MTSENDPLILMVDNDQEFCYLIDRYCETSQCQNRHASTPEEAIALCGSIHPHVLLINLLLPAEGGWRLMQWMKKEISLRQIPLIVYSPLHVENEARKAGATCCLCKPILYDHFISALDIAGIKLPTLPAQ